MLRVQASVLAITLPSPPTVAAVPWVSKVPQEVPEGARTSTRGPPVPLLPGVCPQVICFANAYALRPRTMRKSWLGRDPSHPGAGCGPAWAGTTATHFCRDVRGRWWPGWSASPRGWRDCDRDEIWARDTEFWSETSDVNPYRVPEFCGPVIDPGELRYRS
jgi:hypothetical protein